MNSHIYERRSQKRFSVKYLAHVYLDEKILCSTVINITDKGIGILIPKDVPPDETLQIRMECRKGKETKTEVYLEATVVWTKEDKRSGMFRAGLEISYISEENLNRLREHIEAITNNKS